MVLRPTPAISLEQRALVLESRQQELPDANRRALDRRAADQECLRAGAAEEAGRLEIEEQQAGLKTRFTMPCADGQAFAISCQRVVALGDRRHDLADRRAAVQHVGAILAIDDDHGAVGVFDHGAAEREGGADDDRRV